jgi:hypothetical protein
VIRPQAERRASRVGGTQRGTQLQVDPRLALAEAEAGRVGEAMPRPGTGGHRVVVTSLSDDGRRSDGQRHQGPTSAN